MPHPVGVESVGIRPWPGGQKPQDPAQLCRLATSVSGRMLGGSGFSLESGNCTHFTC